MAGWIILTLSLVLGQVIKLPPGIQGGATILDLTLITFSVIALVKLRFKLKRPPKWLIAALIFTSIAFLSLVLSPLTLTPNQYLQSFAYPARFAIYILFGWTLLSGVYPKILEDANKIFLLSGVGLAALGLLQLVFIPDLMFLANEGWDPHFFRTVSTLLDPNFTGVYLALTLVIIASQTNKLLPKKIFLLLFTVTYLAFITTFSRSSALAFIFAFSAMAFLKKSPKLFLFGVVLFAGFFLVFNTYQKSVAKPRNIDRQQSAQARFDTWQQGFEMFQKSPILGVGFNTYRFALDQYGLGTSGFIQSRGSSTNDSSLLYVLATTGILGIISYLGFLGLVFRQALLSKNDWGIVLAASITGLLVNSFFVNSLFYPWIIFWIILTAVKASKNQA